IHLQKLKTAIYTPLEPLTHLASIRYGVGVTVTEDLVPKLATEQLICRYAICFSCQVKKCHFDGTHATGLSCVIAKLLDLAKDFVNIARILPNNAAFEH